MPSTVEQIKERLNIADVAGSYIKLERAGANFRARCPFHNEKTPSFFISPERGTYHCFGCGVGGDVFTFVENIEGLDFKGAMKILAERAGVEIVYDKSNKDDSDKKARLHEAMEAATIFYTGELVYNQEAQDYLKSRGLSEQTIREFRLGYTKDGWSSLTEHLKKKGFSETEIESAGLAKRGERGSLYDRFRSRIIFPLADASGRVIAFSGRIFPELKEDQTVVAKYLNSPDTALFDKSSVLYGIDKAKLFVRKLNCVIVVEGQMDLLLSHQSGFGNTVALSGTALSEAHCRLLKRFTNNLVLALDSDDAGVKASGRSALPALAADFDVKAARLSQGKDPADIIREDENEWKKNIREAMHIIDYYLAILRDRIADKRNFRMEAVNVTMPFLVRIRSSVDRAHFVSRIAEEIGLSEQSVWEDLSRFKDDNQNKLTDNAGASNNRTDLRPALNLGQTLSRRNALEREIASVIFWQTSLDDKTDFDLVSFKKRVSDIVSIDFDDWLHPFLENRDKLIFEAESRYSIDKIITQTEELLTAFELELTRDKYAEAVLALREAERLSDVEGIKSAASLCADLSKRLAEN